jgi:hypothetical protein
MGGKKVNKDELLKAYKKAMGDVSKACEKIGCTRKTFYNHINNDPEFAQAIKDADEEEKDWAEAQLKVLMTGIPIKDEEGNIINWRYPPCKSAVIFYNKTKNKDRGYVERQEHEHKVIGPVGDFTINFREDESGG